MNSNDELNAIIQTFLSLNTKKILKISERNLEAVDEEFQELIAQSPKNFDLLFKYNEFRVANASKIPKTRPQILLSGALGVNYPNFHTSPLFEVADVVCLTCLSRPSGFSSSFQCNPLTLFLDILKNLPPGFVPDFFWDNQIEHKHFIPAGIDTAPFPIISSVCHTYLHKSIEHICTLFDRVIPISTFYGNILRKKYPDKIMDLPFGLNWASFDHLITPDWDKTIDACITFTETNSPVFANHRNKVIELTKQFKEKYGNEFSIEIESHVPLKMYHEILKKSRITINVTGIHGPYNYRVMEAMCSGSMIFQYDWNNDFFENQFSELFVEGIHGVSFNFENFESKLLYYLKNRDQTQKIAKEAYLFLKENYSYKKLYQQLIKNVKEIDIKLPRNIKPYKGYHDVDMVYYYQSTGMINFICYSVIEELNKKDWVKFNNLMILSYCYKEQVISNNLFTAITSKPLAKFENFDDWSLCCDYYRQAMEYSPAEYIWIIQWNFFILSLEREKANKKDIENMIAILEKEDPSPFNEEELIFKYYTNSSLYPNYALLHLTPNSLELIEFIQLNIDLLKVIDKPKERALLYHRYALKAAHYFLKVFNSKPPTIN